MAFHCLSFPSTPTHPAPSFRLGIKDDEVNFNRACCLYYLVFRVKVNGERALCKSSDRVNNSMETGENSVSNLFVIVGNNLKKRVKV